MSLFTLKVAGYWVKFRRWGFRGIYTFMLSIFKDIQRTRKFLSLSPKPYPKPERGFTLVGPFRGSNSLSKVMRDLIWALNQIGVPYQILDLSQDTNKVSMRELAEIASPSACCCVHLCRYTHLIEMMDDCPMPRDAPVKRFRLFFWEFETGFLESFPSLLKCHAVLGMSDFNCSAFRKSLPKSVSVRKLLYPFRANVPNIEPPSAVRRKYGLKERDFAVFFNFDLVSSTDRKNPEGTMRAFAKAFKDTPSAKLVFKTMNANRCQTRMNLIYRLADLLGITDRFLCINDYISTSDLYSLTNACDVYISLHHGEGFGLGIAEAMTLGKPVVVSDYSASTEFCNADNALLVPCHISPAVWSESVQPNYNLFVKEWGEPDIDVAAKHLRHLYEDPDLRTRLGENGKEFIAHHFSIDNFRQSVNALLDS